MAQDADCVLAVATPRRSGAQRREHIEYKWRHPKPRAHTRFALPPAAEAVKGLRFAPMNAQGFTAMSSAA